MGSINDLRFTPNPEHRPATHARKVAEAIANFDSNWVGQWDGAKADLIAENKRVERELETAANLKPVAHHFYAITSTFHSMNAGQRAEALDQLIEDQDGPTLAALIEAPMFVTSLSAEQRASIKLRLFTKANPVALALRDQLAQALTKMEAASIACIRARAELSDGTTRFEKSTKEAEIVANKARSGLAA